MIFRMDAAAMHDSDKKDGFLFVGNYLALDFLNTRPVLGGKPTELLPDFSALLRWFQAAGLLSARQTASLQRQWGKEERSRQTLGEVRELRERLRKQVLAWEKGGPVRHSTVVELNQLMGQHPMLTRLKEDGTTQLWFQAVQPEDLLAPLAHGAANLFAEVDHARVRKCGQCVLHFYDTSRKGTRRWCSMRLCGNRVKVAAHAARRRD